MTFGVFVILWHIKIKSYEMQKFMSYLVCFLIIFPAFSIAQQISHENYITHGPILGRLSHNGIGIWARTAQSDEFYVIYGTSPQVLDQRSDPVKTELAHDNTAWIHITGLQSDTRYYYELKLASQPVSNLTGKYGSFKTLPDQEILKDEEYNPDGLFNFRFEFACGNNQNLGQGLGPGLPAFATMIRELAGKIDFAILNGDWLYEHSREYTSWQWQSQVYQVGAELPKDISIAPSLVGVWENYKVFLDRGKNLSEWHRQVPSFFTYDDHEILNDVWGAGSPGLRDRRAVFRDIGVRAWYDYLGWSNPVSSSQPIHFGMAEMEGGNDIIYDPDSDFETIDFDQVSNLHVHWGEPTAGVNAMSLDGVGGIPNAGVYEIIEVIDRNRLRISPAAKETDRVPYSLGRFSYYRMRVANCDFFMLDTRGQRQMHDTRDPYKKGLSILGKGQKEWLIDGVTNSDADFIFIVSSVNFMVPHIGGGAVRATNKDDAWTVFFDERESLIEQWDKLNKPVFILTGDLHNSFVIRITDNVWEFASGPHNSENHHIGDEGSRPSNGKFKYGPREVDIRWSTFFLPDTPRTKLRFPTYCVVQVNNVFENPGKDGGTRHIAFSKPQVIFQYYDGLTGELRYAEAILKN
jgi:alkaline phosphatase D